MDQRVVVADSNMAFGNMVTLMVKWVIASIPTFLILSLLAGAVLSFFATATGLLSPR